MKVFDKKGKLVKDAQVICDITGRPDVVRIDGVLYDAGAFKFVDEKLKELEKTKATKKPKNQKKSKKLLGKIFK